MSWTDPSTILAAARDGMASCAAASTLGIGSTDVYHYPEAGLKTTPLPFVVLSDSVEYERHAPGESYGRGQVTATIYLSPDTIGIPAAETAAGLLAQQMVELTGDNLFVTTCQRSMASRIRRSKIAAANDGAARTYFTIELLIGWEG